MSIYYELKEALKALAIMAFWIAAAWLVFSAFGCSGTSGLLNYIPTRSFENRTKQELKEFIANQVTASSTSVSNDIKPIIYGGGGIAGLVYLGTKALTTIGFWRQNKRILQTVTNGARGPPEE